MVKDLPRKMDLLKAFNAINVQFTIGMFVGGVRINNAELWQEYVKGKQIYLQLTTKYGCSKKTIHR